MTKLPPFRSTVRPEWIDYNGHMSEAYYSLVFGHATDALMAETGLGPAYRESTRCSLYTVESHIRFLQDVPEAAHLTIRTRVLGVAARKAHFTHEMYVVSALGAEPPADALPVATTELLAVHVDQLAGRAAAFPDTVRYRFTELTEPPPAWAGRSIATVA
ncbi:thioesterase family protein [Streptomyces sp. S5]|uniref:thioesterase family protein n=1 Tax=Streptomyces sp. S5 TaxID=1456735 RepID=UPI000EF94D3F|nr:thioesterase family protein [Streptomyces sp. S5]